MFLFRTYNQSSPDTSYPYSEYKIPSAKISYTQDGVEKVEYTDKPTIIGNMLESNPSVTNFLMEAFSPSEEQLTRLELVNNNEPQNDTEYEGEQYYRDSAGQAISDFVQFGYIDQETPKWLRLFQDEYLEISKNYILGLKKKKLSKLKHEKSNENIMFNGHSIKTDEGSRAAITSTLTNILAGITDNINFKTATGWLKLNSEEFKELAKVVNTHIQHAFQAESLTLEVLNELTAVELKTLYYIKNVKDSKTGIVATDADILSMNDIYNTFYRELSIKTADEIEELKLKITVDIKDRGELSNMEVSDLIKSDEFIPVVDRPQV